MQILKELQEVDYFIIFCVKTCQRDHLETTYVDHFTLKFSLSSEFVWETGWKSDEKYILGLR